MRKIIFRKGWLILASLLLLSVPAGVFARTVVAGSDRPPIAQQLVREGNLAVSLTAALGLGSHDNEAEAESVLGEAGIVPRNGWIADYPVTPDIVAELEKSVGEAAVANKIALSRDEALQKLREVNAGMSLAVNPSAGQGAAVAPTEAATYPDEAVLDDYYDSEGPPVVTYYAPPPDYYYLYSWVPSPFWCAGFWFPGFFVLNDFHRTCFFGGRAFFVSNHFRAFGANRVFRIDPLGRFSGRTFAGVGITSRQGLISARGAAATAGVASPRGVRSGQQFPRTAGSPSFRSSSQAGRTAPAIRTTSPAFHASGRAATVRPSGAMSSSFAPVAARSMGSSSFGSARVAGSGFSGSGRGGGFGGSYSAGARGGSFGGGSFGRGGGGSWRR